MAPYLTRREHEDAQDHLGACVWLTGLSGSGKTSIAVELERLLHARGVRTTTLDGDRLREGLSRDLTFSLEDRAENIRRASEVARRLVDSGEVVICALISPLEDGRQQAREMMPEGRFLECYVCTPLEVCEARDVKQLYARARRGELAHFTGIDSPYEIPSRPELILDTTPEDVSALDLAQTIERALEARAILTAPASSRG